MNVKYFDYPLQFTAYESDYMEIIKDVLCRGAYILCEDVERFEKDLAQFCGSKYAIGVSNCTDGLLLSLSAAGIGPGDEVISVSHTFVATIEAIKLLGAEPVFVDIGEDHNINIDLVEDAITPKTKAILPVHLNGRIARGMDKLAEIANKHNLIIIEDAAQSLGATYKSKGAGTFGLAGCFSFYPAKLLGAFGDAGGIVTDNVEFAKKVRALRDHGRVGVADANIEHWGFNCRLDNLQAAILDYKLKKLSSWQERRREIANIYFDNLSVLKEVKLPFSPDNQTDYYDVFQNYEIEAEKRDNLREYLSEKGISTILPWGGKGVHQFKALGLEKFNLPVTEQLFRKVLMLPMYPELTNEQIEYVSRTIQEFYSNS